MTDRITQLQGELAMLRRPVQSTDLSGMLETFYINPDDGHIYRRANQKIAGSLNHSYQPLGSRRIMYKGVRYTTASMTYLLTLLAANHSHLSAYYQPA